jgi:intracellular sulfur oxidation DsrE/DsrF family protein
MWTFIGIHGLHVKTRVSITVDNLNAFINGSPDLEIEVVAADGCKFKTTKNLVTWIGDEER